MARTLKSYSCDNSPTSAVHSRLLTSTYPSDTNIFVLSRSRLTLSSSENLWWKKIVFKPRSKFACQFYLFDRIVRERKNYTQKNFTIQIFSQRSFAFFYHTSWPYIIYVCYWHYTQTLCRAKYKFSFSTSY